MADKIMLTIEDICLQYEVDTHDFIITGQLSERLYQALFEMYDETYQLPEIVIDAVEVDPVEWITNKFSEDLAALVKIIQNSSI